MRLLPEKVLESYEKTGLRAIQHTYFGRRGEHKCACAMSVVFVAQLGISLDQVPDKYHGEFSSQMTHFFNDSFYTAGFIAGFDGKNIDFRENDERTNMGREDGRACLEAAQKKGLFE